MDFEASSTLAVRATFLAQRIDIRGLQEGEEVGAPPLVLRVDGSGRAVVFRWGAAVVFGPPDLDSEAFLARLKPFLIDPFPDPEFEEAVIRVGGSGVEGVDSSGLIRLRDATLPRIQVVADVLAKSVVLAHYEAQLAEVFDRIEPVAQALRRKGRSGAPGRRLLGQIGDVLLIQHKMIGRIELSEKPESLWERPDLERLYLRLQDEYEIRDRDQALERKLALVARTAETSLELLQNRRALRVEWYIVILIAVEIVLMVWGVWQGGG